MQSPADDRSAPIVATTYAWPDPAAIPRREWLFGRWALRGELTVILAPGGVGKSTLSTAIAVSLASGRDLIDQPPKGKIGAWLYNLEDAPDELNRQVAATCLYYEVGSEDCAGRLFVNSGIDMPLCTATEDSGAARINEQAFVDLAITIRENGIGLIVIDPLVSSHRVTESSNEAINELGKRWKRLAHETGCAVILVHHTRKLMGREATGEDGRGASALFSVARIVLVLNKVTAAEAETMGITDPKIIRSLIKVDDGKSSRAPLSGTVFFQLNSQSLGNGDVSHPDDSVGVVTPFERPDVFAGMTTFHLYQVQQRLHERDWKDNSQAKDWVGHLVADVAGLKIPEDAGRIKGILKEWKRTGAIGIEKRPDAKGNDRPCVIVGKPVSAGEFTFPHLNTIGGEGGESGGPRTL